METQTLKALRPYLFITLCGLLAFAPVSLMIFGLKNDIVALEYPINHFISQSIHQGEWPIWFNTWGMGFPLQSNLTWGVFSTPQMLFSAIFNYNIITLHIEFIFFVLLAGWGMFHLLKKHFQLSDEWGVLLSLAYMLSGFMVGSSQWLLYLTAASFLPLLISSLLDLLKKPGLANSLQTAVIYTLMFTSVYAAFNIISTYALLIFLLIEIVGDRSALKKRLIYFGITALMIAVLCGPVLLLTIELLDHLERGKGLAETGNFFNSNYLHPAALQSLLFPFASVKMNFPNTEGTMLNSYMGLIMLVAVPAAITNIFRNKNRAGLFLLSATLLFLLLSFGNMLPLRQAFNVLPGFNYFRNPAIFRFFFITAVILTVATTLRGKDLNWLDCRMTRIILILLIAVALLVAALNFSTLNDLEHFSVMAAIKDLDQRQAICIASLIQLPFLLAIAFSLLRKKFKLVYWLFSLDLVINTLACTPFFTVSSYTPSEVNSILKISQGFPIQSVAPSEVNAVFRDERQNQWQNVNVFSKQVSSNPSYRGPLVLNQKTPGKAGTPLVFPAFDTTVQVQTILQRPTHVRVKAFAKDPSVITLSQNHYPGWKVFVNGKKTAFVACYNPANNTKGGICPPGLSVVVPAGESQVDYYYQRNWVVYSALLLHLIILGWLIGKAIVFSRRFSRSSSLS